MFVHATDNRGTCAHACGVVSDPKMQALIALGCGGNFVDVLHAQSGLNYVLKTDAVFEAFCVLNLGHHHVDCIDICCRSDLRNHDQIEALSSLFNHINNIAVHVVRVQPVDADRHGFGTPVDFVQTLDDVFTSLFFLVRCDRILKIEEDDISIRLCCLFKHLRLTAWHSEFTTIEARSRLIDGLKAHFFTSLRLLIRSGDNTGRNILFLSRVFFEWILRARTRLVVTFSR